MSAGNRTEFIENEMPIEDDSGIPDFMQDDFDERADVDTGTGEVVTLPATIVEQDLAPATLDSIITPDQFAAFIKQDEAKRHLLQEYIKSNLKDGTDYGPSYPGDNKKNLLKPGSEKIMAMLKLTPRFRIDKETSEALNFAGMKSVCYICELMYNGQVVGEGRGAVEGGEKGWKANMIVKMAEKRSQVDAVLRVSSLSDIYTQDAEDGNYGKPTPTGQLNAAPVSQPAPSYAPPTQHQNSNGGSGGQAQYSKISDKQRKCIWAIVCSHAKESDIAIDASKGGHDQLGNFIKWAFQVDSSNNIKPEDGSRFIKTFTGGQNHADLVGMFKEFSGI